MNNNETRLGTIDERKPAKEVSKTGKEWRWNSIINRGMKKKLIKEGRNTDYYECEWRKKQNPSFNLSFIYLGSITD